MRADLYHKKGMDVVLDDVILPGDLTAPADADGIVVFAHGSGSSRKSPRNQMVARFLNASRFATLLFDLLTPDEEKIDAEGGNFRFNIEFLAQRLSAATLWVKKQPAIGGMPLGYFGASTGGAAAIRAAEMKGRGTVKAIVSRGGRPDLAPGSLPMIETPTLLIVGENDPHVLDLNRQAYDLLHCEKELVIVPGASHLFEEPGALEEVARRAGQWFKQYLSMD